MQSMMLLDFFGGCECKIDYKLSLKIGCRVKYGSNIFKILSD